jgi:hypothetical protein
VIVIAPAPVVKAAEASTTPPLVVLPNGVVSVMVFARATGATAPNSKTTIHIDEKALMTVANVHLLKINDLPPQTLQIIARLD